MHGNRGLHKRVLDALSTFLWQTLKTSWTEERRRRRRKNLFYSCSVFYSRSWWSAGGFHSGRRWCWCHRNHPRPRNLKRWSPDLHDVRDATSAWGKTHDRKANMTLSFHFNTLQLSECRPCQAGYYRVPPSVKMMEWWCYLSKPVAIVFCISLYTVLICFVTVFFFKIFLLWPANGLQMQISL